jgi:hypothetical protein
MKTENAASESLGGLAMSSDMISAREAALYRPLLENPDRHHDAEGIVPLAQDIGAPAAQDIPHETGIARHEAGMILPTDPAERKNLPLTTGLLDYFPLALAEVAKVSKAGNEQHHPGKPLHWAKEKSTDHADCIPRHLIDRYSRDTDGQRHAAKMAWRALAFLQILLENEAKE